MRVKPLAAILFILFVIALALLPVLVTDDGGDRVLNLTILVMLYVVLAASWNILGGYTGQISLGHAAFFGLGALATRLLWIEGIPIPLSVLAGAGLAVAFALLIGFPAFRLRGVYFAIGTLALGQILHITVGNLFPRIASLPVEDLKAYQLEPRYYLFLGLSVLTIGTAYVMAQSRFGLGMMTVREDEDAAESLGINAFQHKLLALALSALLAGLAGGAFAYYQVSYYYPYPFQPSWSLDPVTVVFIGGTGTILGPIIGGLFFVILKEFLVRNLGEYHLIIFGILFVIVVLFLPGGLVEVWDKTREALRRIPTPVSKRRSLTETD